jgi:LCP family protein required for cell wall assembly
MNKHERDIAAHPFIDRPREPRETEDQPTIYRSRRRYRKVRRRTPQEPQDQPTVNRNKRKLWKPILLVSLIVLLALIVTLFVWGFVWLKGKEAKMKVPAVASVLDPKQKGQPETTLIMGVDKGSVPGEVESRTDILMLVSVNPDGKKAAVISIPRDTRVKIAGHKGYNKINAAHAYGGSALTIEIVKAFTGLPINHFVEIDFQGFKDIVNALGGVKMHIDKAIHDKYAGDVPAGDVTLTGDQALALVRARYDEKAVPGGDLGRIKNQRNFLQAMLGTVSHQRNPFKVVKVIGAVSKDVKTDLSFMKMLGLGRKLRGTNLQMSTAPGTPKIVGGVWYYIVDDTAFQQMLASFKSKQEVPPEKENQADQGCRPERVADSGPCAHRGRPARAPGVPGAEGRQRPEQVFDNDSLLRERRQQPGGDSGSGPGRGAGACAAGFRDRDVRLRGAGRGSVGL